MVNSVAELKRLYELGGKLAVLKAIGYIPEEGTFTPSKAMGKTIAATVFLSKSLISTNWDLAITLGHEMIHVYHNVFLTREIRSFTKKSWRAGDKISEVEAYTWEIEMGNTIQGRLGQIKYLSELQSIYKINYTPNKFH